MSVNETLVQDLSLEGWVVDEAEEFVLAYGKKYPITDPANIHLHHYRTAKTPEQRYIGMYGAFRTLWPERVITYHQWQEDVFRAHCDWENNQTIVLAGGGGIGKGLCLQTKIKSLSGDILAKDIRVGDLINDTEGGIQKVLGVYPQGVRPIYKVSFSDGTSTIVDDQHLWTVYSAKQRDHRSGPQTITTTELLKNLRKDFSLPNYQALCGLESSLSLHPYAMGVVLGDGTVSPKGDLRLSVGTAHTAEKFKSLVKTTNCVFKKGCFSFSVPKQSHPFREHLTASNKSIPCEYLLASTEQRLQLLWGLMDTDGYCSKDGTAQYTTISPQLCKDIQHLARSLGFLVSVSSKIPTYTYKGVKKKGQKAYTVSVRRTSTTQHTPLFTVPHKKERSEKARKQYYHRRITGVEYVGEEPTVCIKVSHPNQLFFIDDHVVTHNTETAALIVGIFFLANPQARAAIVASTTLDSLQSRIFGYVRRALKEMRLPYEFIYEASKPPKIHPEIKDSIHGIYTLAASRDDDEEAIKNYIGRHPKDSMLLVLDEATDLPPAIMNATANLDKGLSGYLQTIVIGNSKGKDDLHGLLATPEVGWDKVDPSMNSWRTTRPGGICLYFNPYNSPAISEKDPVRKKALGKFLMTEEKILKAELEEGVDSPGFWRFTMGFWKNSLSDTTMMSESFLGAYDCTSLAEFSGKHDVVMCAGLDPSFTSGGDKCILRIAALGVHVNGLRAIDFRKEHFLYVIPIQASAGLSVEFQIADFVIDKLKHWNIPLNVLCVDASGQGRALADVIQLRAGSGLAPTKIFSQKVSGLTSKKQLDGYISSGHAMWYAGREFISNGQLYGLDTLAYMQLHTRQIITKGGKEELESKVEYRRRMNARSSTLARSPDEADAAMLCLQSAMIHFGFRIGQRQTVVQHTDPFARDYHKRIEEMRDQSKVQRLERPRADYAKPLTRLRQVSFSRR